MMQSTQLLNEDMKKTLKMLNKTTEDFEQQLAKNAQRLSKVKKTQQFSPKSHWNDG